MEETIALRQEEKKEIVEPKMEVTEAPASLDPIEREPSEMETPYLVELLNIGMAKDHFEMPTLIKEINDFILSQSDDKKSYQEIVDNYLKRLNLPEKTDTYTKIEQLAELIRINKKLLDLAKAKEELLKKPIDKLTSKQLEERINAKYNK